jgi:DNA-directed RNA polymerase sigma subunit (sigma70/sigma32)
MDPDEELVEAVARRYDDAGAQRGLAHVDLVEFGREGLSLARSRFDPDKGFTFATYATWWIRQTITRGLGEADESV